LPNSFFSGSIYPKSQKKVKKFHTLFFCQYVPLERHISMNKP
jgi:hypothetical protein